MTPRHRLLALALTLASSLSAQPIINAVAGTVSDDRTITITGNNFGTKTPAAPILWADFSAGINPSSLGQRTSWSDIQNLFRTTSLPSGSGTNNGVVGTWDTSTGDPHYVPSFSFGITKRYWTKVYVYAKRFYDFDTTTNQKFFRINPDPIINMNDPVAAYHKGWWTVFLNEGDGDNPDRFCSTDAGMSGYMKNQWMNEEFIWQFSGGSGLNDNGSPGAGSGIIDYTRDGVVFKHMENINNGANTQSDLRMLDNFTPPNIPTDTPPNGSHVYMTDMYADDTYSRVMLGNAPTFAASTHREILIPTAWSATSISAVVNQGTFAAGNTTYLYVFDSSNMPNTSGYPVTIAAGSDDTTSPTAPIGLTGTATSATAINLTWTAASDNVAVTGYRIFRNGNHVGTVTAPATTYTDTGLTTGTTYSYTVTAVDAAGNVSPASTTVPVLLRDPSASLLWRDDFDDGQILASKYEDISTNGLSFSALDSRTGTSALTQTYATGQVDAGWVVKYRPAGFPDRVFMRWYHKFEAGFQGFPPKMARIRYRDHADWTSPMEIHCWLDTSATYGGTVNLDVKAEHSTQANSVGWLALARSNFSFATPANIGRWVCFEMEVQLNTPGAADGAYRLWIDDTLAVERTGVDLRGSQTYSINECMLDCYWNGGSPRPQRRFYDSFVIATAKIGPEPDLANFSSWRTANFTGADLTSDAISGPTADPDATGLSNLARYAFGLPARGRVANPVTPGTTTVGTDTFLTLTFPRRATADGLTYTLEASTDLATWTAVPDRTYTAGSGPVTAQDAVALGSANTPRRFLRVCLNQQ